MSKLISILPAKWDTNVERESVTEPAWTASFCVKHDNSCWIKTIGVSSEVCFSVEGINLKEYDFF